MQEHNPIPLVVYCLPIYNGQMILHKCIESILKQTYQNIKILIGDNCSTDATQDICEKLAKENDEIIYIRHHKNNGCYWNYLNLISQMGHMQAKYFVMAQDDSYYHPNHALKCIEFLETNERVISCLTKLETEVNGSRSIHGDDLNTIGLSLQDRIIKAARFDSKGVFYTGVHRSKFFENLRDVWFNLSTNRLTDLEILTYTLVSGESYILKDVLVTRTYTHTAMKPKENYNAYLERHHVASNLRQGITIPFCNGIKKICQQIFQRGDIDDINIAIVTIDHFVKYIEKRYASAIDSELTRAIILLEDESFCESWYPTEIEDKVAPENSIRLKSIFLGNFHRDAIDCYTFMKNNKLKKIIDLCSNKTIE
jgi:glycosyltransferase involved in cell wall biosynthesis